MALLGAIFAIGVFFSGGTLPNPVYEAMTKCHQEGHEWSNLTGCKRKAEEAKGSRK